MVFCLGTLDVGYNTKSTKKIACRSQGKYFSRKL